MGGGADELKREAESRECRWRACSRPVAGPRPVAPPEAPVGPGRPKLSGGPPRSVEAGWWHGVQLRPNRTFPSTGMGGLLALLQRAAQAAAFLAVLAPAAAPGGGGVLPAEPDVLLPELAAGLPKGLQAKLRGLSLQDLVAPLIKDAQGKPQPGKWDADVDTKLPKAVFMRLGELCGAEAGAAISTRLQRGSMGKRPAA